MIAPLHRERPQDTQIILKYLETLEKEPSVVEDKQTDLSVNNRDKIDKRLSASLKYGIAKFIKISSVVKAAIAVGILLPLAFFSGRYFLPVITLDFYHRGFESSQAGNLDRAESYYRLALFLDPNFAEIYFSLGKVYEKRAKLELAEAEYQKAIALQPDYDKPYNNLGRLYIHKKQYSAAIALLKQGLELTKDKAVESALLKNFGLALKEQEKYEEAKVYLQKSLALDGKRAPAYCLLAQILEIQGNKVEVGEKWKNCLRYASEDNPDEKIWKNQAQKRLQPQNTQK
jgi:tetratricopeptide (TPR) repeat protein